MSNKTIFKRISLVAITALGAGVLSITPASADDNAAVAGNNATAAAGLLNVATQAATLGDGVTDATPSNNRSLGLLANSTTLGQGSLTSTATMSSTGEIVFYTVTPAESVTDGIVVIEVSGGAISEHTGDEPTHVNVNQTNTLIVIGEDDDGGDDYAVGITPNAGSTTMTVSMYTTALTAAQDTTGGLMATVRASIIAGTTSKGTLAQRYLVTVAATSASGVISVGDSYIAGATSTTAADGGETNVDATDSLKIASQTAPYAYININLRDAYDVSLDGGKGALVITGTNGAGIAYKDDGTAASSASDFNLTQVSNTSAAGKITVTKPAAAANKAFSTTVSISWNGVVVGTKTVTFLGEVASMVVTPRRVGALGATSTDAFRVTYADSAGNSLTGLGTVTTTVVGATTNSIVTGAAIGTQGTSTDAAKGSITCAAGSSAYLGGGSAQLQMQFVNTASGTTVKSNVFTASCQGNAYTYTASWDKASYTPGSVATLTLTFKDRDGDLANGYDTVAASNLITITGGPSTTAVTIPATTDKPDGGTGLQGIKTYQFAVGTTEGDFVAVVTAADISSRNSSQANATAAYSVKSATSSVSNADVLKSIVALIASINKQIQALQKLILKR